MKTYMQQALGARNNKVFQKEIVLTFYLKLPGIVESRKQL